MVVAPYLGAASTKRLAENQQTIRIPETRAMKVTYDRKTDTLSVLLHEDVKVAESDEDRPGRVNMTELSRMGSWRDGMRSSATEIQEPRANAVRISE